MVVSHMAIAGVGIWIAFTSGSTLRLFHTETLKHLQDVNVATPVHHMLPGGPWGAGGRCHIPRGRGSGLSVTRTKAPFLEVRAAHRRRFSAVSKALGRGAGARI